MNNEILKQCYTELHKLNGLTINETTCDFNELLHQISKELTRENKTIDDYFTEWETAINEITEKEKQLIDKKETYTQMEQKIIENTDFKELYGQNNQKIRDNHVKNELKDLVDEKHDLQIRIDYLKRRVDFIKSLMGMQRVLLGCGVVV